MRIHLIVYFGAVLTAILLVPIVSQLAKKWNLLDAPSARKVHKVPLPRVGGIAIVFATFALVLPVFFFSNTVGESFRQSQSQFIALLSGAFFIFLVGLIDDLRPVPGGIKLLSLVAAALTICSSGATINSFSLASLFSIRTGLAAWPLTVCWIVGIAVCVSAIDGLDGLAAGIAAIVCGILVILSLWSGQEAMAVLMMALLGSITGFLFFNFYPAKIFMGDCGSLFLGFMIGASSVIFQMKTSTIVGLAIPFLVLGVPILDTGLVVAFRAVIERRSMFAPDRNHLHHRLLRLGLHHRTAVIVIYAMTAICASLGIFMMSANGNWSVTLLVGGIAMMFSMFVCLQRGRYHKLLTGLKHNLAVAHQARIQKRRFEDTQVQMRESNSFAAWWQTLCNMAAQMGFSSLGLWERENGAFVNTCAWDAKEEESSDGRILQLSLPVKVKDGLDRELRACIVAQNCLELGGRQAMLLTRLMDEYPMPENPQDKKAVEQAAGTTSQLRTDMAPQTGYIPNAMDVLGVPVVPFESYDKVIECAERIIESNGKSLWIGINLVNICNARQKSELKGILRRADVGFCDSTGIVVTSKILGMPGIVRISEYNLFLKLITLSFRKGWGIYLLGGTAEVNAAARAKLKEKYPDLKIVGWHDGYFEDSDGVIEHINSSGAKLLFLALRFAEQEQWIDRHRHEIDTNMCVSMNGGFDVAAGRLKGIPWFFTMTGTGFLYRFLSELRVPRTVPKMLLSYLFQVMGKKAAGMTLTEEDAKKSKQ